MSALLLATAGSSAMAQGSAAPLLIGTTAAIGGNAYSDADRVASTLLAGGVSRLAAIRAQQGSVATSYHWPAPAAAPDVIVNAPPISDFQGALPGWQLKSVRPTLTTPAINYGQIDLLPPALRGLIPALVSPSALSVQAAAFALPKPAIVASPVPRSGLPDIFGSVAMAVSHTSLDRKWASIAQPISGNGLWSGIVGSARSAAPRQQLEMINSWVNRRLRFADDPLGSDSWAPVSQSLQRGAGDCEDYAIVKMKLLEAAGFDRRALFLVIARDLVRQADHAILAVRIGDDLLVLDNMTDRILPSSAVSDYRPIMSFNAFGRWTHGYRVKPAQPVQFAAR